MCSTPSHGGFLHDMSCFYWQQVVIVAMHDWPRPMWLTAACGHFHAKALLQGHARFLKNFLGIQLHKTSTDTLSMGRYVPNLHVEKIKKLQQSMLWSGSKHFL